MSLSGEWMNELRSRMRLDADADGTLRGTYHTSVGDAGGIYPLVGSYDPDAASGSQSLAFCVTWRHDESNSHSATAWAGQLQHDEQGEIIVTTWLLTHETDPSEDWESTMVGQDVYRRVLEGEPWKPARPVAPHPIR